MQLTCGAFEMDLYKKLRCHPYVFLRLTGLRLKAFTVVVKKCRRRWNNLQKLKKLSGRPYALSSLENQILCLLIYYRTYTTQMFLGFWFGVDDATICRSIKRLEPILAKIMSLQKIQNIAQDELESLLIDATEQRIQRPSRDQRTYYSGKKKCHTLKTEIVINTDGRILQMSKPVKGAVHDLKLRRQQKKLPSNSRIIADLGYQGLQKDHPKAVIPHKKLKNSTLSEFQKAFNTALSRVRVKVENKIREIKIFKILSDVYRNSRQSYHPKIVIIAGLVNLKSGF